ncbi:MAG: BREX-1 system adenine-specific DNA-methyltransferase PglX [Sulfurovum sp.]|nr:BREX-1 system adenine-specific DNA-methyltransferase PglX [Sulfurovum sp.]
MSDGIKDAFVHGSIIENISPVRQGFQTGDNDRFLRLWFEIDNVKIGFSIQSTEEFHLKKYKYAPYNKGGEYRKWFGNNDYLVAFDKKNYDLLLNMGNNLPSRHLYFKLSITWSALSSGSFGARWNGTGYTFSAKGACSFPEDESVGIFILALLNSKISEKVLEFFSPTLDFNVGDIRQIPLSPYWLKYIGQVKILTQQNIDISKEEWDSRETSWDFRINELIRMKNEALRVKSCRVEDAYNAYCDYWREKFYQLHANEEELNRLFIDIYELQDELTPDVPLEDITILKNEAKIVDGELVFQPEEIMKQLVSYGVGAMFGRYSLDHEGLHIANMNESLEDANLKHDIQNPTFEADDDNIIPVVDEPDYFADDIAERFEAFVAAAFGREYLYENIAFIEKALGKKLRNYFVKEFYKDHVKRYKKRPIYWMFASPKGMFQVLIYMHRYTPDTLNQILNDYLRPFRIRLESMRNDLMRISESEDAPTTERNLAERKIEKIDRTLDDINAYEKVLAHYAAKRIAIDLDDGVKVNYCKFKELVVPFDKKMCK